MDQSHPLAIRITDFKGVGQVISQKLHDNDIFSVRELLLLKPIQVTHVPLRTVQEWKALQDTPEQKLINSTTGPSAIAIHVTVQSMSAVSPKRTIMNCIDSEGQKVFAVSVQPKSWYKHITIGSQWILEGIMLRTAAGLMMTQPVWHKWNEKWKEYRADYAIKGLKQSSIRTLINHAILLTKDLSEPIIKNLHAIHELKYLDNQSESAREYQRLTNSIMLSKYKVCRDHVKSVRSHNAKQCILDNWDTPELPFKLTNDQRNAVQDILQDIQKTSPMSRMLQADVGAGKTIVALLVAEYVAQAGFQSVFMAPTNILANQHYATAKRIMRCPVFFLTNKTKAAERREIINYDKPCLIVGTHAVTYVDSFPHLAFAIIDEQHKFGVQQRLKLRKQGVHALSMSATPIPRSLCLTSMGYLELSIVREKPPGRSDITTILKPYSALQDIYKIIQEAINSGYVVYWVCHRVVEDPASEQGTVEGRAKALESDFTGQVISMYSGSKDKDEIMTQFRSGAKPILVASTVVEVGMDVHEAKVMIIEQSELFGLAQLHQLRGRVGRGNTPGICVLLYSDDTVKGMNRLEILEKSQDGFEIALKDKEIRGGGDILGMRQSGLNSERFFDSLAEMELDEDVELLAPTETEKVLWAQTNTNVLESV